MFGSGEGGTIGSAFVRIRPETTGFQAEAKAELGAGLKSLAGPLGGILAGVGIFEFGKKAVEAFSEAQHADEKMNTAIEKSPYIVDKNTASFSNLASALQRKTRFDDEETKGAITQLAAYKLTGNQIKELIPLIQDYASRTGTSLPAAAKAMGLALLGNGRALKSVGLDLKDQKDPLKNYTQLIDGLRSKVGGFAEKEGKTFSGQMTILKNQFGEILEKVGGYLVPVLTDMTTAFAGSVEFILDNGKALAVIGGVIGAVLLPRLASLIASQAIAFGSGVVDKVGSLVDAIGTYVTATTRQIGASLGLTDAVVVSTAAQIAELEAKVAATAAVETQTAAKAKAAAVEAEYAAQVAAAAVGTAAEAETAAASAVATEALGVAQAEAATATGAHTAATEALTVAETEVAVAGTAANVALGVQIVVAAALVGAVYLVMDALGAFDEEQSKGVQNAGKWAEAQLRASRNAGLGLRGASEDYVALSDKVKKTTDAIAAQNKIIDDEGGIGWTGYNDKQQKASDTADRLGKQLDVQKARLHDLGQALKDNGVDVAHLGVAQDVMTGKTKLSALSFGDQVAVLKTADKAIQDYAKSADDAASRTQNYADATFGLYNSQFAVTDAIKTLDDDIKKGAPAREQQLKDVLALTQAQGKQAADALGPWATASAKTTASTEAQSTMLQLLAAKYPELRGEITQYLFTLQQNIDASKQGTLADEAAIAALDGLKVKYRDLAPAIDEIEAKIRTYNDTPIPPKTAEVNTEAARIGLQLLNQQLENFLTNNGTKSSSYRLPPPRTGLAVGGPAEAGRTYLVGEKGPELFTPNESGRVITNEVTNRLLASASTGGASVGGHVVTRGASTGDSSVTVKIEQVNHFSGSVSAADLKHANDQLVGALHSTLAAGVD